MIFNSENKSKDCLEILAFNASGVVLKLLNPLFAASISHSSLYPSPSKRIFLECLIYSLKTLKMASSFFMSLDSIKASTSTLKSLNCFATIAFKVVIALEQFAIEPTALNSNLFPVKANGEVLFLSVLSKRTSGIFPTTFNFKSVFSSGDNFPVVTPSNSANTLVNCSPINTEIIAGGASLAPSL
ncbi:hypothetical protein D3C84_839220 [compost metagenome]